MLVSQLDNHNYFVCLCDDYGGAMPHGCIAAAPPPFPWDKQWAQWNGKKFVMLPDHRQRRVEEGFAPELVQDATEYWLPPPHGEDTHQSPARTMTERGPLPEGAQLKRPEKSLSVAQDEKRQKINTAHEAALAGSVALSDPTPSTVAVESALLAVQDAEGLEYMRSVLDDRRAELLGMVNAASTLADVETIPVGYPV